MAVVIEATENDVDECMSSFCEVQLVADLVCCVRRARGKDSATTSLDER